MNAVMKRAFLMGLTEVQSEATFLAFGFNHADTWNPDCAKIDA
jgi:hypothetical protein